MLHSCKQCCYKYARALYHILPESGQMLHESLAASLLKDIHWLHSAIQTHPHLYITSHHVSARRKLQAISSHVCTSAPRLRC